MGYKVAYRQEITWVGPTIAAIETIARSWTWNSPQTCRWIPTAGLEVIGEVILEVKLVGNGYGSQTGLKILGL